ncbi:MAG: ectonucleotide pyrophosphatase/phosphodiesterase [Myxococcota bacterium]
MNRPVLLRIRRSVLRAPLPDRGRRRRFSARPLASMLLFASLALVVGGFGGLGAGECRAASRGGAEGVGVADAAASGSAGMAARTSATARGRSRPIAEAASVAPTVVLISLDGTRPEDVSEARLPSLAALARRGLSAEAMVPVAPTNTFPNHVSLVTGVHPEVHGVVDNHFTDPERGDFDRDAIHAWIESEPIWSIAERSGLPTASFYWVGSEGPWSRGPGPREARRFSSRTRERTKVDRILHWLAEPDPAKRPRLVTCWFHGADHAAHVDGPDAPSVAEALAPQDRAIARLVDAIDRRGLFASTTLIFVSDHGMVAARERINLGSRLRQHGLRARTFGIGGFATIVAGETRRRPRDLDRIVEVVRAAGLEAWRREQAPPDWHVAHPRFGDVVVRAPVGTAIVTPTSRIVGFHGHAPEAPEMAAILIAYGRGVRNGAVLPRVSSLSVAPTVLRLLGLDVPPQMKAKPIAAMLEGLGRR